MLPNGVKLGSEGYEGVIEVNDLTRKFLTADVFINENHPDFSLKYRLNCDYLWDRVHELYTKTDAMLCENDFAKRCANIREWDLGRCRREIFLFKPDQFKKY